MTFAQKLATACAEVVDEVEAIKRIFCRKLTVMVVGKTPVLSGLLRGNWQCSAGQPRAEFIKDIRTPDQVLAELEEVLKNLGPDDTFWLSNNAPYVLVIEYEGHSRKAPAGMARVSIAAASRLMNEAIREMRAA